MDYAISPLVFGGVLGLTDQIMAALGASTWVQQLFNDVLGVKWGSDLPVATLNGGYAAGLAYGMSTFGFYTYMPPTPIVGPLPGLATLGIAVGILHFLIATNYWWKINGIIGDNLTGFLVSGLSGAIAALALSFL